VAAYELYLRGNDPANLRSDSGPHRALEYFRQAVAIDSTYAAAWAGMARMYGRLTTTKNPGMPVDDLLALSESAARRAIALDDSVADGHAALALYLMNFERDYGTAEMELKRAVELDPAYGRVREWLVHLYLDTERPVEALAEARRALEVDPLSPSAHAELAHALLANGRPEEALDHLRHIEAVRPPLLRTRVLLFQTYAMQGKWTEANEALGPPSEDSFSRSFRAYLLARSGRREEAVRIRQDLLARWRLGEATAMDVMVASTGLRDFDAAFAWIDRAIEDRSAESYVTVMAPMFAELRQDPRFDRVRERLGLQKR
jgi:tetratricopeptide (TPR) repeat protein